MMDDATELQGAQIGYGNNFRDAISIELDGHLVGGFGIGALHGASLAGACVLSVRDLDGLPDIEHENSGFHGGLAAQGRIMVQNGARAKNYQHPALPLHFLRKRPLCGFPDFLRPEFTWSGIQFRAMPSAEGYGIG